MILLGQYIQLQSRNLVQETEFVPVINFENFSIDSTSCYLSWNCWKVSKSKEVDNPYADDETHKVLTNIVDTGKVDGEKNAIDCHQTSVTKLIKQNAR